MASNPERYSAAAVVPISEVGPIPTRNLIGNVIRNGGNSYLVTSEPAEKPGHMMVRAMGSGRILVSMPIETIRQSLLQD